MNDQVTAVRPAIKHYRLYIDGRWEDAQSGARFDSINPYNGEVCATMSDDGPEDVGRAEGRGLLDGPAQVHPHHGLAWTFVVLRDAAANLSQPITRFLLLDPRSHRGQWEER